MASYEGKYTALETVYKLGFALDALNYHDLAPLFYSDRKFNFDIFAILKTPATDVSPLEYFDIAVSNLGGFDATQHVLTNPIVAIIDNGKAHVKVMVLAFHGLMVNDQVEGATARVTWDIDLENQGEHWFITKWVIRGVVPIDRPDIFGKGHQQGHSGKLRAGIVRP